MIERSPRNINSGSKYRVLNHERTQSSANGVNEGSPKQVQSQNEFYDALRVYAQRLKEQRDTSLSYMTKFNEASEKVRMQELQIARLNKINRQLIDKLSVYESVLTRSRVKSNKLRMSNIVDKQNMLESIIQYGTSQQTCLGASSNQNNHHSPKNTTLQSMLKHQSGHHSKPIEKQFLFQQFFIVSPGSDSQITYHYKHNNNANKTQESIKVYVQHPQFVVEPYQGNSTKFVNKRILYLADSPYTSVKKSARPNIPLVSEVNPSYYYFGFCIMQKELMNMNGKYFWVPMVYGFITYYPFPQHFLKTLQIIVKDFPNLKDHRILQNSLNNLNNTIAQIIKDDHILGLPAQIKYNIFDKPQILKLPALEFMSSALLGYSADLFKNYALQLIVDVLMLLLLEIPITVISEDVQLLGKFMLYFVLAIRPLKYPFPIVFSLPQQMQVLLQSPFPTFIGCTDEQMIEKFMSQRAVFDLDKKSARSWPILDHLDASRQYLMTLLAKNGSGYQNVSTLIQTILNGKDIKQIQNYWKDFSRTQIFQLYSYGD